MIFQDTRRTYSLVRLQTADLVRRVLRQPLLEILDLCIKLGQVSAQLRKSVLRHISTPLGRRLQMVETHLLSIYFALQCVATLDKRPLLLLMVCLDRSFLRRSCTHVPVEDQYSAQPELAGTRLLDVRRQVPGEEWRPAPLADGTNILGSVSCLSTCMRDPPLRNSLSATSVLESISTENLDLPLQRAVVCRP